MPIKLFRSEYVVKARRVYDINMEAITTEKKLVSLNKSNSHNALSPKNKKNLDGAPHYLPRMSRSDKMRLAHLKIRDHIIKKVEISKYPFFDDRLFTEKSMGKLTPSVRIYFICVLFRYVREKDFKTILKSRLFMKIVSVGEFCITIMYLDNHVQDYKYGIKSKDSPEYLINRAQRENLYREMLYYIQQNFSKPIRSIVNTGVEKLFRLYEEGMALDYTELTYENFCADNGGVIDQLSNETKAFVDVEDLFNVFNEGVSSKYPEIRKPNYQKLYLTRIHLMNSVFFQIFFEVVVKMHGKQESDYPELRSFSRYYGLGQQAVNDNSDYIPREYGFCTVGKLVEDTFSDMKRKLVTLPIMCIPESNDDCQKIINYFQTSKNDLNLDDNNTQRDLLHKLIKSKALKHAMYITSRVGKKIDTLPLNANPELIHDMKDMFSFVNGNRCYKIYNEFMTH